MCTVADYQEWTCRSGADSGLLLQEPLHFCKHVFVTIYRHIQHRRSGFFSQCQFWCARNRKSGLGAFEVAAYSFFKIRQTSECLSLEKVEKWDLSMYLMGVVPWEKLDCERKAEMWKQGRFDVTDTILYIVSSVLVKSENCKCCSNWV